MKLLLKKVRSYFPSPLPKGMTEFEGWAKDVIAMSGAPDNDSVRFALATMIMHSGDTEAYRPKHAFVLKIKKSMANQVAAGVINDLKAKQEAERLAAVAKAAEEAAAVEASANVTAAT